MKRIETAAVSAAHRARARQAVRAGTSVAIAIVLAVACRAACAGSTTASLPVTATVQSACAASVEPLAFGTYTAGGGPVTGSATITVKCSSGLAFKVALGPGTAGVTLSGTASNEGLATSLVVFAQVPDSSMNRLARVGVYSDLVTVTIMY